MSRTGSRQSPTPTEWIRGWITSDGKRHPGILERLDLLETLGKKQNKLLYTVLIAVVGDTLSNSSGHLIGFLKDAYQLLASIIQ